MAECCIFCTISSGNDEETEILKQNKELVCFRDICPAAPHHYLVIPKEHIVSCLSLHKSQHGLVERMAEMGKAVLQEQGVRDMTRIQLGFHIPPYTSVHHLHLHVLAPSFQISEEFLYKFTSGQRFVEAYHFRNLLETSWRLEQRLSHPEKQNNMIYDGWT
ncbi:unnamed protein product [Knipowitschia caucasica]|uniref:HIT domain-containing protein n=1 Tax=Knipowitschia caucasica TaxID=637954 RepID=A0AAV2KE13_KNICA